ncbi:MAG TPA: hypothetical protein VMT11_07755 [Myxococcaceae bacterium]|nr:hypothetical protein [Myxococcaceae bacterium]
MTLQPSAASVSAIALAPRLPVVVGLLLGLVLLPLISLGCGPPT